MSSPRNRVTPQVKAHLSVLLGLLALVKAVGLLAAALRAHRVHPRLRRRRRLHRRQRPAARHQPAAADHGGELRALHHQHLAPRLDAADPRRRPVGADRGGRRRDLPAVRAARPGGAERAREGSSRTSPATSRPPPRRWASATSRSRPFELETDPDAVDLAGNADTVRNIRIWDPSEHILGQTFPQLQRHPRLLRDQQRRRRPLRAQRRAAPRSCSPSATSTPAGIPRKTLGGRAPHLHARLRRHRGAGQREGDERRAGLRGRGHPVPDGRRRARAHPARRLLR